MLKNFYHYLHQNNIRGKDRIYAFLKKNNLPYKINFKAKTGLDMLLDPKNYIDGFIIKYGGYESEVLQALCANVKNKTILWDIGANIGFHSLSFKINFPKNVVIAFEPDYKNFSILNNHKKINKLDVKLMNFALSDKIEVSELYSMEGNNGMSTLDPWHEFSWDKNPHSIACYNGDFLIENNILPAPTLIKLDVEGHELKVLLGLKNTLHSGKIKQLVIEQPNNFIEAKSEIKDLLLSFNYQFRKLQRAEPSDHGLSNFEAYLN